MHIMRQGNPNETAQYDRQLHALSQELTEAIEQAKAVVRSCKIGNYEET